MSTPLILSMPAFAPPLPANQWVGMTLQWHGYDGSVWDFSDAAGGVVLSGEGLVGLHNPEVERFVSQSRAMPGHRLRGWRARARDVIWPVLVWSDSSAGWIERQDAFFDTVHPDRVGTWTVRAETETRRLRLTGVFNESHAYDRDPALFGWAKYGIALEAAQPYWEGEEITAGPWIGSEPVPFFPPGGGPPLHISESSTLGSAVMENPGDVPAWSVWEARGTSGSLDDVVFGVGASVISVPFPVAEGSMLRIDTDPRSPSAKLGPIPDEGQPFVPTEDVTRSLGLQSYAPIPPGSAVPVTVAATGSGDIRARITPLYFRAF